MVLLAQEAWEASGNRVQIWVLLQELHSLMEQEKYLLHPMSSPPSPPQLVGNSPALRSCPPCVCSTFLHHCSSLCAQDLGWACALPTHSGSACCDAGCTQMCRFQAQACKIQGGACWSILYTCQQHKQGLLQKKGEVSRNSGLAIMGEHAEK